MGLARRIAITAAAVFVLLPVAGAPAWQASFSKFFSLSGVSGQAHKLVLQKCQGGKLGNWTLIAKHYILIQDHSSDLFVQLDMRINVPITTEYKKLSVKKFELDYSENFPDDGANEIHDSLVKFFNSSFAKSNSDASKLTFKQNGLYLGGEEVIEPDITTAPLKVKPGCSPV
jgi:hypothetical protein